MNAYELANEIEKGGKDGFYQDEMVAILRQQANRIAELEKENRIDAIKKATEAPCGWIGYFEGKICTFLFRKEDMDSFLKNTDPCGKVSPVYATPQTKQCKDCGEINPAEIHTCSPQTKDKL